LEVQVLAVVEATGADLDLGSLVGGLVVVGYAARFGGARLGAEWVHAEVGTVAREELEEALVVLQAPPGRPHVICCSTLGPRTHVAELLGNMAG